MIREYFDKTLESDRQSVQLTMESKQTFSGKVQAIVHSSHHYRMPISVLNEAEQFYPDEWAKIEQLKQFKLNAFQSLLEQAENEGRLRPDVNLTVLSSMLERVSKMFIDTNFLLENGLKPTQAIDEALNIIIYGIVKRDSEILGNPE
jgi:hypothetical protein